MAREPHLRRESPWSVLHPPLSTDSTNEAPGAA
ncbi:predicted protein [Chaetomium globosum CBS 148.51]|uniref:Uncharacterized protein n=1 Tax=Chaetomium globosum (strain ATCC 6205 / CBS 148.51 / DSM 1962 / NBRC 6347 / NRRL 1970) TaxID=306901 RepID=Q2HI84_CHAGB|nr:uncharacterized protein CHGG_00070 [Chaetomium globosum CBS 148.51]EAQ91835.1 predicted protein [Chaetomium globosum CBS 148.51]